MRSFRSSLPVLGFPGGKCLRNIASQSRRRKLKFFGLQSGLENVGKQSQSVWLEMQLVKSLATIQECNWKKRIFFLLPPQPIILPFAFLLPLLLLPLLRVGKVILCLVNRQHTFSGCLNTALESAVALYFSDLLYSPADVFH